MTIIGPSSGMARPAGAAQDLTALAVRAGNLRAGVAGAVAPAAASPAAAVPAAEGVDPRGPAVEIDPLTARLAAATRATMKDPGEVDPAQAAADAAWQARAEADGRAVRRMMAESAEQTVRRTRQQIADSKEMIRIFEETGEVWLTDQNGKLAPPRVKFDFAPYGGAAGYIAGIRERLEIAERLLPGAERGAAAMRADYMERCAGE